MTESPQSASNGNLYQLLTGLESRLMLYFDKSITEVKELFRRAQERTDELARTMATKDELLGVQQRQLDMSKQLQDHLMSEGHSSGLQRLATLETAFRETEARSKGRPFQTWQVVTAILFLLFSFTGTLLSLLNFLANHPVK